ncbi:hypothetical protein ACMXYX_12595 [Neptuniibacter sp. QD72_48]|uniref:hypothetical protein n=1 Tax=unclassified Neptuniibacter TaxID=2630693 RepID=UPI0039F70BC0
MNRDDDNIEVPNFGPADPAGENRSAPSAMRPRSGDAPAPASAPASSGGGVVQSVVMVVLVVAVSVLGYFGFEMYQSQQATFEKAQEQIVQLEALLKEAEQGAAESGEELQGNVSSLESVLKQKDKQLDSEIAKLWDIAHKKNKPLIEKQAKELAALKKTLQAQEKTVKSLKSQVAQQKKTLASVSGLKKTVNAEVAKLTKLTSRVESEMRTTNELAKEQMDDLLKAQRTLTDRLAKVEGKSNADLERKVKVNEQAIRAFDGTRRQLNQDLLQVRQKLNNMQLLLEQR